MSNKQSDSGKEGDPELPPPRAKHTVHWFRKGLRLHDNPSLRESLRQASTFRCVFIIDPWFAGSSNVGINKWRFLLECLEDLDNSLRKLNSRLFVVRGQPADALSKLFKEWGTTNLSFEEDPEPFGRVRDQNITAMCREVGITVVTRVSHTLYKLDRIIEKNGGSAPLTYHQFQALIANMHLPLQAEPTICYKSLNGATTPVTDDHDDRFGVPTLEELGFDTVGMRMPVWVGGESEALIRLEKHLERKAWVASFGRPKMTPQSLLPSKTGLSPYLRFGCLSTRLFYYKLTELYKRVKRARPPLSLHGQLLWREFFYCAATRNPNFDRMSGNPICVQIPWEKNPEALAKWANGQTGYPWIDAIMTQLREEGWIHHLARHAVACFLTRGDLWVSWEEGMKVFDEILLDADWSVNAGMWMWLSCSSFFQQFFHCYCPVKFGRKADPNGDYIRKYLPVLKNFPTKYIHEPWKAPESEQKAARCEIGTDYPVPIVDHSKVSEVNIARIKQVYQQLAKYRPQVSPAAQITQSPNVVLSSPSLATVITNVNPSNYLCKTSPALTPTFQNNCKSIREDNETCNNTDILNRKKEYNNSNSGVRNIMYNRAVLPPEQSYNENKDNQAAQDKSITSESYERTAKEQESRGANYYSEQQKVDYNDMRNEIMNYQNDTNSSQQNEKLGQYTSQCNESSFKHPDIRTKKIYGTRSQSETRVNTYNYGETPAGQMRQLSYESISGYPHDPNNVVQSFNHTPPVNYKQDAQYLHSYQNYKQSPMDCNEHMKTSTQKVDYDKSANSVDMQGCSRPESDVPD